MHLMRLESDVFRVFVTVVTYWILCDKEPCHNGNPLFSCPADTANRTIGPSRKSHNITVPQPTVPYPIRYHFCNRNVPISVTKSCIVGYFLCIVGFVRWIYCNEVGVGCVVTYSMSVSNVPLGSYHCLWIKQKNPCETSLIIGAPQPYVGWLLSAESC